MLEPIWGVKTEAIFDVWTFEHILTGLSVGSIVIFNNKKSLGTLLSNAKDKILHSKQVDYIKYKYDIIFVMMIAYIWETVEHYLETGLGGEWLEYWFQGVEYWPNRLISDPLMLVLGYLIVKKYNWIATPARILSLIWIIVHLFVFPHSMYLHEIL